MYYSIGEVANATNIAISTLRYYDREGMFPAMERSNGGIRVFSDIEINTIRVIECLKSTGMSIKEIKQFLNWCQEGDSSLRRRRDMFYERLEEVTKQMEVLQKTMYTIKYKCWYYDKALADGSEKKMKNLPVEEIPEELRDYRIQITKYSGAWAFPNHNANMVSRFFKPQKTESEYGRLICSAIEQHYSRLDGSFMMAAPIAYGAYEEDDKLKIFVTVFYERYKLYGKTWASTGGDVIPGAFLFTKADHTREWAFEQYPEVACFMEKIKGLAEKMNADYSNSTRQELLTHNLKEHLMANRQTGVSLRKRDGGIIN